MSLVRSSMRRRCTEKVRVGPRLRHAMYARFSRALLEIWQFSVTVQELCHCDKTPMNHMLLTKTSRYRTCNCLAFAIVRPCTQKIIRVAKQQEPDCDMYVPEDTSKLSED